MQGSLQAADIVVIHDQCEVCGKIVAVRRSGHLKDHRDWINRRWKKCIGGGMLAITVIEISRADKREIKSRRRSGKRRR